MSNFFHEIGWRDLTIVPTVIVDIFVARTKYKKKPGFFLVLALYFKFASWSTSASNQQFNQDLL